MAGKPAYSLRWEEIKPTPSKRITRQECYRRYEAIRAHYAIKLQEATENLEICKARETPSERGNCAWRWSGVKKHYENLLAGLPARALKNCDPRPYA